jgi:hypothetical protein
MIHRNDLSKVAKEIDLTIDEANQGKINTADWFCVFNFPPQVEQAENPNELLQKLTSRVLSQLEETEESTGLTLSSLNAPNDRKPGRYDKVWAVSMKPYLSAPISLD